MFLTSPLPSLSIYLKGMWRRPSNTLSEEKSYGKWGWGWAEHQYSHSNCQPARKAASQPASQAASKLISLHYFYFLIPVVPTTSAKIRAFTSENSENLNTQNLNLAIRCQRVLSGGGGVERTNGGGAAEEARAYGSRGRPDSVPEASLTSRASAQMSPPLSLSTAFHFLFPLSR